MTAELTGDRPTDVTAYIDVDSRQRPTTAVATVVAAAGKATKRRRDKFARLLHQFHATAYGATPSAHRGQARATATSTTARRRRNILNDANQSRTSAAVRLRGPSTLPLQHGKVLAVRPGGWTGTNCRVSAERTISDYYYAADPHEASAVCTSLVCRGRNVAEGWKVVKSLISTGRPVIEHFECSLKCRAVLMSKISQFKVTQS